MLNEIRSHSPEQPNVNSTNRIPSNGLSINLPELSTSPATEPLKIPRDGLSSPSPSKLAPSLSIRSLVRETRPLLSGPRTPTRTPQRKQVAFTSQPSEVHTYELEYIPDDAVAAEDTSLDVNWNSVTSAAPTVIHSADSKISKEIPQTHRPLPAIRASGSNYSIKSMPNMESSSDDSEQTIAPSPHSQELSNYYEKHQLSRLTAENCPNLAYDHDEYLQRSQRGELKEPLDIKENKQYREDLKRSIIPIHNGRVKKSSYDQAIEGLGDLYETNVRNTDGDTLNIKRNTSVKSTISISSADRQLATKIVNKRLNSVGLKDGIQGFTDDDVKEILEEEREEPEEPKHQKVSLTRNIIGLVHPVNQDGSLRSPSAQSMSTTVTNDSDFLSASEGGDFDSVDLNDSGVKNDAATEVNTTLDNDSIIVADIPRDLSKASVDSQATAKIRRDDTDFLLSSKKETTPVANPLRVASDISTTSSFAPEKFVLQDPQFDFDGTDDSGNGLDSFEYDPDYKLSASDKARKPRRIISSETSPRGDILDIWSKQEKFRNVSSHSDDFQAISPPTVSRFVVRGKKPKLVQIVPSRKSSAVRIDSVDYGPTSWIKRRLEVLPTGEINRDVDKTASHKFQEEEDDSEDVGEEDEDLEDEKKFDESQDENLKSSDEQTQELQPKTSDISLQDSIDLANYLDRHVGFEEGGDDSFLKDLSSWDTNTLEDQISSENEERIMTDTNVSKLWRDGTLTKKSVVTPGKFAHLSVNEMENFMIRKRIASDGFEIKKANGKAVTGSYVPVLSEQRGQMVDSSFPQEDDSSVSAIVSDLAIPSGLNGQSSTSSPSVGSDEVFSDARESVDEEGSFDNSLNTFQPDVTAEKEITPAKAINVAGEESIASEATTDIFSKYGEVQAEEEKQSVHDVPEVVPVADTPSIKLVDGEQGRLFLRLTDLKDLKLPQIQDRNAKFQAVLDNGIHVLTTDFFDIGTQLNIPINKEFELIVGRSLEVIITLKLRYLKLRDQLVEVKERKTVKSKNFFARLFGVKNIVTTTKYVNRPARFDPLSEVVATDGSFAKIRLNFDQYKNQIVCEPHFYNLQGFNEWKMVNTAGGLKPQPFGVCSVGAEMLFIPRRSEFEVLPVSIKNALSQVQEVNKVMEYEHQGYMFQEGGDLDVWTRRFFRLKGYDMNAYNDDTMKLKAKINLRRVVEIVYPGKKEPITVDPLQRQQDQRVISETLILNDGYKLRFSNGETIDFGCDSRDERDEWVKILEEIIMKNNFRRQPWVKLMSSKMARLTGEAS
ncbi:DEKNAAC102363 [Brettanomyces naardenensis]|uniref:DEKNAAC102363 n=1 Tax=Brettanomyces naardenensis TaxID=13370 RepID=A0A448YLJ3_BRENA|nr:DEKNAAC102363 [Brettanomyces naardenensis]